MYWYLDKPENRPRAYLQRIHKKRESGEMERLPKEQQTKLIETVVAWEQAQGMYFYEPNRKMYKWFLQPHWIKGIRGGNRSGKTSGCVIDLIMQVEGWHPLQKINMERLIEEAWERKVRKWLKSLWAQKIFLKMPPLKMRCSTVDYTTYVDKVTGPEFEKWATRMKVREFAYANDKKRKIIWNDGSFIEFMTYEQPILTHGGAARDAIFHDEEPPNGIWEQSKMRVMTTSGRMTLGMTAEQGVTWTEDDIWKPGLSERNQNIYASQLSSYENPVNTQEMIEKIKETCRDDTEIAIRIYGKSTPRGGNVYPMVFESKPWVIDPFDIPHNSGYLVLAIDPHPQLPHACLWIWVDYQGIKHPLFMEKPYLYECAELFEKCNIPQLASFIREKERYEIGREHDFVLCDPYAWNEDQNNPKTLAEQLQDNGLMVQPATKDRDSGIVKVQEMLSLQIGKELPEDNGKAIVLNRKHPQIMTFDTLTELLRERKKYRWKRPRQRFIEDTKVVQKPVDKDDHFMENEYRVALFVVDGALELIQSEAYGSELPGEPAVTVNGNKMDVSFKVEEEVDAYLGV
jgi:hypothetical protein